MAFPSDALVGQNTHVTLWDENPDDSSDAEWGTKPGSPVYVFLPVDEYGVRMARDRRNNTPYLGQFARKHGRSYKGLPQGQIRGKLHGYHPPGLSMSLAQFVMQFAFSNPTSNDLKSFGAEWAQGPDLSNKQHNGLRVNSFTLQGSEQSGVVEYTLDVMGKSETQPVTAQTVPDDLEKLLDFEFPDVVFEIDMAGGTSYTAHNIESFQIQRNNGLRPKYLNSRTPTALKRTMRETNLQIVIPKHSDTWDDAARSLSADAEVSARLTLLGLHNGTAANNYTKLVIVFPRLQLVDPDDRFATDDYAMTTLNFQALKPDTSAAEISLTWSTQA